MLRSSVGTWAIGSRSGIDDDGLLADGGGDGSNGVGTSARADVGSLDNGAGGDATAGVNSSDGAGDSSGRHDDSGDTTDGVSTRRNLGRRGIADSRGVLDSDGRCRDGVDAGSRARSDHGSRHHNNLGGGRRWRRSLGRRRRRRRSLGRSLGRGRDREDLSLGLGGGGCDDYSHRVSDIGLYLAFFLRRRRSIGMPHTRRLASHGLPDGGTAGSAHGGGIIQTLPEKVLVGMTVVGGRDAAGQRRQGGGNKLSLHCEYK